jgi:hypothetical protein
LAKVKVKDFRELLTQLSPRKKLHLKDCEFYTPKDNETEFSFDYNKQISAQMDGFDSVKSSSTLVTEEGLRDWLMQSIGRKYDQMPE